MRPEPFVVSELFKVAKSPARDWQDKFEGF
jgi:hypothetical protein